MTDAAAPADGGQVRPPHRVVVIGGGFAGFHVVRGLRRAPVEVTLIDRRNFTLFQPLLYQVATGVLSPANIATPLRSLFARQRNARILLDDATGFDLVRREVRLAGGAVPFDTLVVACGSRHHYFGHPEWELHAPGLKSLEDAEDIRRRIFSALEAAERTTNPVLRQRMLTFVVAGGGPTSVELAGAVAEITRRTTRNEFRTVDPGAARVLVVEAEQRLLAGFSPASSAEAARALASLDVEVLLGTRITGVSAVGVTLADAQGAHDVAAGTVLWGAGVRASPIGASLMAAAGVAPAPGGRVPVGDDCSVPGFPDVFVLGDMASFIQDGKPLPGVAQVAIQQGEHVARLIAARCAGTAVRPFRYRDLGSMATIGKRLAVVDIGNWHLKGRLAWLAWLGLHLVKLIRFENRLLVLIQWLWSYLTWSRSTRLITGEDHDRPKPSDPR